MSLSVDDILGPNGALAAAMPGYEHRPEQLALARAVERALNDRHCLMAEAGTGTGKTLAYLAAAVLCGRKVVVSTATKTLQEQIFFKDIPLLRKSGLSFDAAYLKGRSNYLCLQRFEKFDQRPEFASRDDAKLWPALREWALQTETGDRAELELPDGFATWPLLSTTPDTCLGTQCALYEPCHVTRARRRAESALIVVVNHHLFFADLAIRSGSGGEGVLPPYEAVIFDEAHALEDAATEFFGMQVSNWRFDDLVADAVKALPATDERASTLGSLAIRLSGLAQELFTSLGPTLGIKGDGSMRLEARMLKPLESRVNDVIAAASALASASSGNEPELSAVSRRASDLSQQLDFIRQGDSHDHVYWAESRGRGLFLRAAPIDIAKELQSRLYSTGQTAIFTSATLATDSRFDYFAGRVGLQGEGAPAGTERLAVASPFHYPSQAALYVPDHLPEPNDPGFVEAVAEHIAKLVDITSGRAFALFTSLRNLDAAHQMLRHRLPFQVLKQGDKPKLVLLEQFKRQPSVLFAAHSFWEGVDVAGDALSLVVIDKLPFAAPNDPLVAARIQQLEERGEDAFNAYQVPRAAIALRQGFGRLIRTKTDRGIVAVLDRRLRAKAYGRTLLRSLPAAKRFERLDLLSTWFNRGREPTTARAT